MERIPSGHTILTPDSRYYTHAVDATLVNRRFSLSLLDPSNAALEWQASSLGLRSRELLVACPLKWLVR
jgi:hypothetical protein